MFATLYNTVEKKPEWLEAAQSCAEFSRKYCHSLTLKDRKMYFSVTEDGKPLRMRRYVYSESFAAISYAANALA
jgi:N-acylglucosamine 2-epimerase